MPSVFLVFSAVCHSTAGIRGELQPPPPPTAPYRPSPKQLQDPQHQGITVIFSTVSVASVQLSAHPHADRKLGEVSLSAKHFGSLSVKLL